MSDELVSDEILREIPEIGQSDDPDDALALLNEHGVNMARELTERRECDAPITELTGLRERLEFIANNTTTTIPEEIEAVCDLAATAVVELAERRERERWIPVSERLPDDGYVLGWFPGCGRPGMFFCSTVRHWQNDADPMPGALWRPL